MNQAIAVFITCGVASSVAIWSVLHQRAVGRRKATLEYIEKSESDGELLKAKAIFIKLIKDGRDLSEFANEHHDQSEQSLAIVRVLNNFELIAISIKQGVFDYKIFKLWHGGTIIVYWHRSNPFVKHLRLRLKSEFMFNEFEEMALRMEKGRKSTRNRRIIP
jgi:hypothetical protein